LLVGVDAPLEGGGEGVAEQGASLVEGELLAGVEDGARGGVLGDLVEVADVGDGLLQGEAFGVVTVFDGQSRHRKSSLIYRAPLGGPFLPTPDAKIQRGTPGMEVRTRFAGQRALQ
jgi:hypothetical protein